MEKSLNFGALASTSLENSVRAERQTILSIVIPVFDERDNLRPLYKGLREALDPLALPYEMLFVDDGSRDGSAAELRSLAQTDSRVRVLEFVRNFGQTAAMSAGFEHAEGEIIISLDADLQNDPADIPEMLAKLAEGYDVVSCWRRERKDAWLARTLPSQVANKLISTVSGVHLHDYGCTLKAYRREVAKHIQLYGEMHRFLPIFATWAGARVAEIPVRHHPRRHGQSKYGMERTLKVLLDLMTIKFLGSYSTKPMYLFGGLGFASFAASLSLGAIALWQKFNQDVTFYRNPLLLLAAFFFLAGFQFVFLGLVAELLVRTYHEAQNKPIYILKSSKTD